MIAVAGPTPARVASAQSGECGTSQHIARLAGTEYSKHHHITGRCVRAGVGVHLVNHDMALDRHLPRSSVFAGRISTGARAQPADSCDYCPDPPLRRRSGAGLEVPEPEALKVIGGCDRKQECAGYPEPPSEPEGEATGSQPGRSCAYCGGRGVGFGRSSGVSQLSIQRSIASRSTTSPRAACRRASSISLASRASRDRRCSSASAGGRSGWVPLAVDILGM